ncbi:RIPOR family member 3 isoform X2 [Neoarius graeffei]|uniref:RIPOR family member 3 isoform X2 n=1 Tax=Neoarius graeffei TaxID=443677 RepID=UPI00298C499C|nr:RIPOR family member 3 isoform X2 [Neoarius graeffei]
MSAFDAESPEGLKITGVHGMSVKLQFDCPSEGGMVQRSCSFIGVNTLTGRHRLCSARSSLHTKGLAGRSTKIPTSTQVVGSIWEQQPEQVDRVFQALQKGLKEHIEGHKAELEFLSSQQSSSIRNSRLAFFYDLEKEIRALERYIRRLEFQISKVEGLYETYCIQWRLCQGAVNMKRAFSLSPSSRASRESLLKLNCNHRHSLEDMSAMEGELEILLGELQIKMKGLIGFARLCPGDQYEVLIRLGQQRWRIRGRIQTDDKQLWNQEEMFFFPHIHEGFEIKVTEVKGLSSILVGIVTCKCTDFYTAHPQMMVVDITELGTIKLQLEVVWNPFDSGMVKNLMSSSSRQSTHSRKRLSMLRQFQEADGSFSTSSRESRGVSLISYLSDSAQALSPLVYERASYPPIFPDLSMDYLSVDADLLKTPLGEGDESGAWLSEPEISSPSPGDSKRDAIFHYQCYRTPDILQQTGVVATNQVVEPVKSKVATNDLVVEEVSVEERIEEIPKVLKMGVGNSQRRAVAMKVGLVQAQVAVTLQEMSFAKAELKRLNLQILQLDQVLKRDIYILHTSSSEALDVEEEEVLGSFDFLSIDFNTEDSNSYMSSSRLMDTRFKGNIVTTREEMSEDTVLLSEQQHTWHMAKRADTENRSSLSTGEYTLDQALEIHLKICLALLSALRVSNLECMQQYILEDLSRQTEVLEKITTLKQRKTHDISATELWSGAPKLRNVMMMWDECCGSAPAFCCTADSFIRMLRRRFIHKVKAKLPGQADTVFAQLLQQVQSSSMMVPLTVCTTDLVTLFQLHVYLSCWKVTNFEEHIFHMSREEFHTEFSSSRKSQPTHSASSSLSEKANPLTLPLLLFRKKPTHSLRLFSSSGKSQSTLSTSSPLLEKVYLVSCLETPKRRRVLKKMNGRRISELQPMGKTLQLLAKLLTDASYKVAVSATSCLCRASGYKSFRIKALVHYTWLLKDNDIQVQQQACLALKCLKALESADQVAELWHSTDEELRNTARETIISFGKKGHKAFQRMDQISAQLQEEIYKNLETEITIF